MKRPTLALVAAVAAGLIWAATDGTAAQSPSPSSGSQNPSSPSSSSQSSTQKAPSVTLTGCLTQGSSSSVFILDNARANASDRTEKGQSYVVTASASSVDLKNQLNHEVRITGTADEKAGSEPSSTGAAGAGSMSGSQSSASASGATAKIDEKDMPKLQAMSLVSVANSCQAG